MKGRTWYVRIHSLILVLKEKMPIIRGDLFRNYFTPDLIADCHGLLPHLTSEMVIKKKTAAWGLCQDTLFKIRKRI